MTIALLPIPFPLPPPPRFGLVCPGGGATGTVLTEKLCSSLPTLLTLDMTWTGLRSTPHLPHPDRTWTGLPPSPLPHPDSTWTGCSLPPPPRQCDLDRTLPPPNAPWTNGQIPLKTVPSLVLRTWSAIEASNCETSNILKYSMKLFMPKYTTQYSMPIRTFDTIYNLI